MSVWPLRKRVFFLLLFLLLIAHRGGSRHGQTRQHGERKINRSLFNSSYFIQLLTHKLTSFISLFCFACLPAWHMTDWLTGWLHELQVLYPWMNGLSGWLDVFWLDGMAWLNGCCCCCCCYFCSFFLSVFGFFVV